ncbi:MAG TPA: hypothetical protein PK950_02025 [Candidatus Paceibacterota bacterium]|nr:hypothetical protein [Candidatus Paceibacterota bacterium]
MSIHDDPPKIKTPAQRFLDSQKGHNIMVFIVILGVSVAGFSLGLMSAKKDSSAGQNGQNVIIETNPSLIVATAADYQAGTAKDPEKVAAALVPQPAEGKRSPEATTGAFVASKKGKKYYPVDCAGAKSLSESNRIYFKDAAEAESKGYSLSSSCQ